MLARSLSRSCAHLQGRHPIHVLLLEVVVQTSTELQGQAGDLDLLPDLDESGNGHGAGELDVRSEVGDVDRVAARAGHHLSTPGCRSQERDSLSLSLWIAGPPFPPLVSLSVLLYAIRAHSKPRARSSLLSSLSLVSPLPRPQISGSDGSLACEPSCSCSWIGSPLVLKTLS